ncbi:hypothetical protein [uncultured Kordia sp.]|uniref:hypothetical protein n=1 Tax=uncultured Kordia sp. TaxID=507699 RepID=UPI00262A7041|nr:hypothetical protein [uncultured Kordia sp.]
MKKIASISCLLMILISCQNKKEVHSTDKDLKNDLQFENLHGNVKEFTLKKAYPLGDSETEFQEAVVHAIYTFNEAGNFEKTEIFNDFGKLDTRSAFLYNNNELLVEFKMRSFSGDENMEVRELNTYNEDALLEHQEHFQNQKLVFEADVTYDTEKNITTWRYLHNNQTMTKTAETFLDDQDRIIKIIETSDKENIKNVQSNVYDDSGNLIKHEANIGSLKFRDEYTYENGKRVEMKNYSIPLSEEVFLDMITNYDAHKNAVKISHYENAALKKVFTYTYEYDAQGNWIKKITHINRNPASGETFDLYLLETRDITYW